MGDSSSPLSPSSPPSPLLRRRASSRASRFASRFALRGRLACSSSESSSAPRPLPGRSRNRNPVQTPGLPACGRQIKRRTPLRVVCPQDVSSIPPFPRKKNATVPATGVSADSCHAREFSTGRAATASTMTTAMIPPRSSPKRNPMKRSSPPRSIFRHGAANEFAQRAAGDQRGDEDNGVRKRGGDVGRFQNSVDGPVRTPPRARARVKATTTAASPKAECMNPRRVARVTESSMTAARTASIQLTDIIACLWFERRRGPLRPVGGGRLRRNPGRRGRRCGREKAFRRRAERALCGGEFLLTELGGHLRARASLLNAPS